MVSTHGQKRYLATRKGGSLFRLSHQQTMQSGSRGNALLDKTPTSHGYDRTDSCVLANLRDNGMGNAYNRVSNHWNGRPGRVRVPPHALTYKVVYMTYL